MGGVTLEAQWDVSFHVGCFFWKIFLFFFETLVRQSRADDMMPNSHYCPHRNDSSNAGSTAEARKMTGSNYTTPLAQ